MTRISREQADWSSPTVVERRSAKEDDRDTRIERRQARCEHVWQHESIIQPGGMGYSTSWCRKCNITAHEHARLSTNQGDSR